MSTNESEYPTKVFMKIKLSCTQCKLRFSRSEALKRHSSKHPRLNCHCIRCNSTMNLHTLSKEPSKIYPCRRCGKEFELPEVLRYHEEQHLKKNFQWCPLCREKCNDNWCLKLHMKEEHSDTNATGGKVQEIKHTDPEENIDFEEVD